MQKKTMKGMVKVQFIAAQEEIEKLITDGYPTKAIWKELSEKKKFDGTYAYFCRIVDSLITTKKEKQTDVKNTPIERSVGGEQSDNKDGIIRGSTVEEKPFKQLNALEALKKASELI